ncbi:translation initiation factor IF-2 N-terminal domain-containing protein [Corynebacterium sp. UMB9976]|uniref:translation initiation factor IF-2 N-terminal domain-containing protein n=1 Tax=Corynebacterium sp. UMB9976 TaxID=3046354 RepID=UPI002549CD03|nr:translation initiation factor IF-2 N-terminal domain-containing protein [Corynebacterium sp. UMB9976]MDK6301499.1 translation initiation factor IF-2 N-terminal domain-containing protein [Corynebacterium sp. UMB9976]
MAFTPEPALIESAGKINTESFGRRVRVHSVAKELGITSKEFIAVLGEFGITGKVPSSTLSNEEATDVVSRLAGGGGLTQSEQPAVKDEADAAEPAADKAGDTKSTAKKAGAKKAAAKKSAKKSTAKKAAAKKSAKKAAAKKTTKRTASKKAEAKNAEAENAQQHQAAEAPQSQAEEAASTTPEQQASTSEEAPQPARRRVRRIVRRVGSRAIQQDTAAKKAEASSEEMAEKREQPKKAEPKKAEPKKKEQKAEQRPAELQPAAEEETPADQLHPGEREEADIVDEPVRLKGSTRLESKRRWREENRERGRHKAISRSEFLARRESVHRQMMVRDAERHDHTGLTTQVGVVEDGQLVEHFVTSDTQQSMIGNIYLGRVQNVLASMEAAFIDIGTGRNAVLYASEVNWHSPHLHSKSRRIDQALRSGDQVMVQVIKDPVGHKGARLTNRISFAGRYLVYFPGGTTAGISRKLPEAERKRLKEILQRVVPGQGGAIIRTAAENVAEELIEEDVNRLHKQWLNIEKTEAKERKSKGAKPVTLYEEPNMLITVIRDLFNEDFSELLIEGDKSWRMVRDYMGRMAPELMDRVHKWHPEQHADEDVFAAHRLDDQLAKALSRKVWLPSGGHLVIDHTEAMTVIDVNTGSFVGSGGNLEETVTENNLEAAEEIVRQMRLRDIGGMIVVDFIDMVLEENQDLVLRRLIEYLGRDRTHHKVSEVTSLGLVQITRKRLGAGLLETFSTTCECCDGRGVIVHPDPVEQDFNEEPERRRRSSRGNGRGRDEQGSKEQRKNQGSRDQGREEQRDERREEAKGHEGRGPKSSASHGKGREDSRDHSNSEGQERRSRKQRQGSQSGSESAAESGEGQKQETRTSRRGGRRSVKRRTSSAVNDATARAEQGSAEKKQPADRSGDQSQAGQERAPRRVVRRIVRRTAPSQQRGGTGQRKSAANADAPELKISSREDRASAQRHEQEKPERGSQGARRRGRRVVRSKPAARQTGARQAGEYSSHKKGKGDQPSGQKRGSEGDRRNAGARRSGTRGAGKYGANTYEEAVKEFENSPRRRRRTRGNSVSDRRPQPEDFGQQPEAAQPKGEQKRENQSAGKSGQSAKGETQGRARGRRRRVVRSSPRR